MVTMLIVRRVPDTMTSMPSIAFDCVTLLAKSTFKNGHPGAKKSHSNSVNFRESKDHPLLGWDSFNHPYLFADKPAGRALVDSLSLCHSEVI
jgi:hypothetical protein